MKLSVSFLCVALLTALSASTALAAGNVASGLEKSKVCVACHNVDGNSTVPTFPRLAGQQADYIVHSLTSYKKGKRKNEIMKGMVASLTKQDIEDLAAYFSAQTGLIVKR